MKSIANVWIRMKMIYLLIKSNIKTLIDLVDMSIYIISGNQLNNLVKIGMTFDPVSRIRNMQTYHPEPVRYIRIYTLTFSNNITLRDLEKALFKLLQSYKYTSPHFHDDEKRPMEFYSDEVIDILDKIMEFYKINGVIDYIRFDHLNSYIVEYDYIENWDLIEILKGRDKAYSHS